LVVTYWTWDGGATLEAGGYVSDRVESGGRCTLTLTRGGTVLAGDSQAYPDSSTTACGSVRVSVPSRRGGDWEAVLSYESSSSRIDSAPFTVPA
jgi:hypothetical protein